MINFFQKKPLLLILAFFLLSGCSDKNDSLSSEEKLWQLYSDNNRLERYNELKDSYGNNYWILKINEKEDSWWITNFVISVVSYIFPFTAATLTVGGAIWIILLITGIALTGGTILKILASVGSIMPLAFLPASIAGIAIIGIALAFIHRLFIAFYESFV